MDRRGRSGCVFLFQSVSGDELLRAGPGQSAGEHADPVLRGSGAKHR